MNLSGNPSPRLFPYSVRLGESSGIKPCSKPLSYRPPTRPTFIQRWYFEGNPEIKNLLHCFQNPCITRSAKQRSGHTNVVSWICRLVLYFIVAAYVRVYVTNYMITAQLERLWYFDMGLQGKVKYTCGHVQALKGLYWLLHILLNSKLISWMHIALLLISWLKWVL
jgi:hypothetical protein